MQDNDPRPTVRDYLPEAIDNPFNRNSEAIWFWKAVRICTLYFVVQGSELERIAAVICFVLISITLKLHQSLFYLHWIQSHIKVGLLFNDEKWLEQEARANFDRKYPY